MDTFADLGNHIGVALTAEQLSKLQRYQGFLGDEAIEGGGIGPHERDRLGDRHIADAMLFLRGIPDEARSVVDIGSGVGLPGVPIAICRPDLDVTLVDRSERRTDLAKRAVRILEIPNVEVVTMDAERWDERADVFTFRASFPIEKAASFVARQMAGHRNDSAATERPTVGLLGVSRLTERPALPDPPAGIVFDMTEESHGMLDSPFWLLRMTSAGLRT